MISLNLSELSRKPLVAAGHSWPSSRHFVIVAAPLTWGATCRGALEDQRRHPRCSSVIANRAGAHRRELAFRRETGAAGAAPLPSREWERVQVLAGDVGGRAS